MPYFINIVLNISNKDVKYQIVLLLNDLNPDSLMNFLGYFRNFLIFRVAFINPEALELPYSKKLNKIKKIYLKSMEQCQIV